MGSSAVIVPMGCPIHELGPNNPVSRTAPPEGERLMPIQIHTQRAAREGGRLRESVYMAAYEVYAHVHRPQPAMIEGDCRGGFSIGEIVAFLYARAFPRSEWRDRVEEALRGSNLDG